MLNLQNQIGNEEIMKQLTHLSTNQMLFGNLAYIVLFLALGYLVFKFKRQPIGNKAERLFHNLFFDESSYIFSLKYEIS